MNWNPDQLAIFDHARQMEPGTTLVVSAGAGTGKSTTLEELARILPGDTLALAFNKSIATSLGERFKRAGLSAVAGTVHSQAFKALKAGFPGLRFKVDGRKYAKIVREYVDQLAMRPEEKREAVTTLTKLAGLSRLSLIAPTDTKALERLCIHHDIVGNGYLKYLPSIILIGDKQAEQGVIDFDDMVVLPVLNDLPFEQYDNVLTDECQDLNPVQLEVALRSCKPTGRKAFVGDEHQAIYGFTGADSDSVKTIIERTDARVLPLMYCYRCPVSHVRYANELQPALKAAPGAIEGSIERLPESLLAGAVQRGDLVLCRKNAPLLRTCIRLIASGIQARVRGRNVAGTITKVLTDLEKASGFSFDRLHVHLEDWRRERVDYLRRKDASEDAIMRVDDTVEAINAVHEANPSVRSVADLVRAIEALFADKGAAVWLSSVHRAKGLEAERVFILRPEDMPLTYRGQRGWQLQQERNIMYVARTRAKSVLTELVNDVS